MAMNVSTLKVSIKAKRLAKLDPSQIVDNAALDADCEAIAEAVIQHIQLFAQVSPGIAVATAGTAAAQTGATTAPGLIT
jgi:hypothetical protein